MEYRRLPHGDEMIGLGSEVNQYQKMMEIAEYFGI